MTFQVHKPPLSGVPCLLSAIQFLICLLLCSCLPKSCRCYGTNQDELGNITLSYSFDKLPGHLFMSNLYLDDMVLCDDNNGTAWGGLGSYREAIGSPLDYRDNKGWSYNKGEPILIYEYMMNGSLDQHLFSKRGDNAGQRQQQQEETPIGTWQTRYCIAKDIATGLHYVHHEHEPTVLHRDIKASNIMVDSTIRARLGDFGIASTVAVDRSSVTGIAGTWGYIAPEYALTFRSTRQTDVYAFGVLILELVTGKKNGDVPPDDDHITDWVWRLHREGKLLEAVDAGVLTADDAEDDQQDGGINILLEAERLLLLGLACTNPNPYNRPSMVEAVQVITKLAPPPEVPLERPIFMWPPQDWRARNSVYSTALSDCDESSPSTVETVQVSISQNHSPSAATGGYGSISSTVATGSQRHGSAH